MITSSESASIVVNLSPPEVTMSPGDQPRQITVTVQNAGNTVDQYTIEIENLDPSWYTVTAARIALFPGDSAPVTIMVHPPKSQNVIAGRFTYEVRAISDNRTRFGVTKGVVEIAGVVQVQASLDPKRITGRRGNFHLTLSNTGTLETQVELSGSDAETNLNFKFKDSEPTIPPYEKVEIPVAVKSRFFNFIGQPKHYPFTIIYPQFSSDQQDDNARNMRQVQGEFIHKPILRSWRFPIFVTLMSIALFIAFIVRPDPCGPLLNWTFLCTKVPPLPPASISAFTIVPSGITTGESVKLIWTVKNVVQARILEDDESVPVTNTAGLVKKPTRSRPYTLCVKNSPISEDEVCQSQQVMVGSDPVPTPTVRPTRPPTVAGGNKTTPAAGKTPGSGAGGGGAAGGGGGGGGTGGGGSGGKGGTPTPTRPRLTLVGTATPTHTRPAVATTPSHTSTPGSAATATSTPAGVACGDQSKNTQGSTADPPSVKVGDKIVFTGKGFTPGKPVQITFFNPLGDPVRTISNEQLVAADDGTFQPRLPIDATIFTTPGRWHVNLRDTAKDYVVTIFFCVAQ